MKAALLNDGEFDGTQWGEDAASIARGDWPAWIPKPDALPQQGATPQQEPVSASPSRKGTTTTPPQSEAATVPAEEPFSLTQQTARADKPKPKATQLSIDVPPPTVGERPIIGREVTPEEAPLFSEAAKQPDAEQLDIAQDPEPVAPKVAPEVAPSPTEILASALRTALRLAPTYAAAHEYLGRLQVEAGRPEDGARHLELAFELDPTLVGVLPDLARFRALRGDLSGCAAQIERFFASPNRRNDTPGRLCEARAAAWTNDREALRVAVTKLSEAASANSPLSTFAELWILDSPSEARVVERLDRVRHFVRNPRFLSLMLQLAGEIAGFHGLDELALRCVKEAAEGVLIDLDWLDRCPTIASLRTRPEWSELRQLVRTRAEAIWAV